MPYLYAAFYEASQTGMPVQRSLCIDYPFDGNVYDKSYQYQFLFGKDMLVAPLTSVEKSKQVYLPKGDWYNLYSDETISGQKEFTEDCPLYKLPVYIKASAIIPAQSLIQSTKEKPNDTLYIHIYSGTKKNTFTYYEDEGNGFGYTKNVYCRKMIEFDPANKRINISKQEGLFNSNFKKIQLIFHGFDNKLENIHLNNANTTNAKDCNCKLLNELDNLDDIYDPNLYQQLLSQSGKTKQQQVTIDNSTNDIMLQW